MQWLAGMFPVVVIALSCVLMMVFMMRGMHGGQEHDGHAASPAPTDRDELTHLRDEVSALREEVGSRR